MFNFDFLSKKATKKDARVTLSAKFLNVHSACVSVYRWHIRILPDEL